MCGAKRLLLILLLISSLKAIVNHPTELVIERILSEPVTYPIKFAFLGDSRNSWYGNDHTGDSIFSIERQKIEELGVLFLMHGGDFVEHGYQNEYEEFVDTIDAFNCNLLTVRGNHELYADEGPYMYYSIFGETDYFFDYGNYRFIVMADCQQSPYIGEGYHYIDYYFSENQISWLDSILADANQRQLFPIVFVHVPPYLPEHDTTHCLGWDVYYPRPNYEMSHTEEFTNLLRDHKVPLALFGHQHFYDRWSYEGVCYVISGGGGSPLVTPPLSGPPNGGSFYHFILFELEADGLITGYVYRAGDATYDPLYTFSLEGQGVGEGRRENITINLPTVTRSSEPFSLVLNQFGGDPVTVYITDPTGRLLVKRNTWSGKMQIITPKRGGLYILGIISGKRKVHKKFVVIP
jgi:predicted phosphodiesterase